MTVASLVLLVGHCVVPGGWDALFAQLERVVVPFYTGLVLLYLSVLILAGPLETLYYWWRGPRPTTTSRTTATTSRDPTTTTLQPSTKAPLVARSASSPVQVPVESATTTVAETDATASQQQDQEEQPFDLSGAYKLVSNDNFDGFLAVQGVPWALRRAANQARPIHRLLHQGNRLTIKIEGLIESQTTYRIGGPPVETNVRGRIFQDVVRYLPDQQVGILVSKKALTEDYDVTVQRQFREDLQEITMTSQAVFRDGRETVQCVQQFQRLEEEERQ